MASYVRTSGEEKKKNAYHFLPKRTILLRIGFGLKAFYITMGDL